MLPKVTVIITCYNYRAYVEAAIQSVVNQTYEHLDCVIIDDCSTDGSYQLICDLLAGLDRPNFRALRMGRNSGQMAAFRAGLENSTGHFVVFLDADDLIDPAFVATHVAVHLNGARSAGFTASNTRTINAEGVVLEGSFFSFGMVSESDVLQTVEPRFIKNYPASLEAGGSGIPPVKHRRPWRAGWPYSATSSFMFRRDVLNLIITPEADSIRLCADYFMIHLCSAMAGSLLIFDSLGSYRVHGSNQFISEAVTGGERRPRMQQWNQYGPFIEQQMTEFVHRNAARLSAVLPDQFLFMFPLPPPPPPSALKSQLIRFWDALPSGMQKAVMPIADFIDARVK